MLIQFQLNSVVSYPSQERYMESTLNSSEDSQQRNPNTCLCIQGPRTTSCPHVPQPAWAWGFLRGPRIKTSTQFWLSHKKHWRIYVGNTSQIWVQSIPRTQNYVGGKFLIYSKLSVAITPRVDVTLLSLSRLSSSDETSWVGSDS